MRNLHQLLNEVATAQSPADKEFVAIHKIDKKDLTPAKEVQFKGGTEKDHSKMASVSNETGMKDDIEKEKPIAEDEQLDELAKPTLKSYVKKAEKSSDKAWAKADREEDKAMSTNGEKYPEKQERHQKAASAAIDTWNKRRKGMDNAKKRLTKEDLDTVPFEEIVEANLQELAKKTLASYITKAGHDIRHTAREAGVHRGLSDRQYTTRSVKSSNDHFEKSDKLGEKAHKRMKGVAKAAQKLATEEVEQIDEISKKTLGSYVNKATNQIGFAMHDAGAAMQRSVKYSQGSEEHTKDSAQSTKAWKHAIKRKDGIAKAVKRLTKEDVEQIDEISKQAIGRYVTAAVKDHGTSKRYEAIHQERDEKDAARGEHKRQGKRLKGITAAVKRLTKD